MTLSGSVSNTTYLFHFAPPNKSDTRDSSALASCATSVTTRARVHSHPGRQIPVLTEKCQTETRDSETVADELMKIETQYGTYSRDTLTESIDPDAPTILDFYCGRGGVGRAITRLGWNCIGIDTADYHEEYPGFFIQADASSLSLPISVDLSWASPPCQAYTKLNKSAYDDPKQEYPTLSELHVKEVCADHSDTQIIENVVTCEDLNNPVKLNGRAFELPFHQERWFETSFDVPDHRETSQGRDRAPIPIGGCRNRDDQANRKHRLAIAKRVPAHWPESAVISGIPDHYVRYLLHWCPDLPTVPLPAGARSKYNLSDTRSNDTELTDFSSQTDA